MTNTASPPDGFSETIGYVVPWITGPGSTIDVKVSTTEPLLKYHVVRLIQGPQGLDFSEMRQDVVPSIPRGTFRGRYQVAYPGSYAIVKDVNYGVDSHGIEIVVSIQPHLLHATHDQTIFSTLDVAKMTGCAVVLSKKNTIEFWIANGTFTEVVRTGFIPLLKQWMEVRLSIDGSKVGYNIVPKSAFTERLQPPVEGHWMLSKFAKLGGPYSVLFAASFAESPSRGSMTPTNFFNGRLEGPTILSAGPNKSLLAKWDFSQEISSDRIVNVFGGGGHGQLVNAPTRAVTSSSWDGTESDWTKASGGYDSIHFHEDDLDDANWDTDITITLPECLRSGVYAVVTQTVEGIDRDTIPFFVRPTASTSSAVGARMAYIISTFTYLAYANEFATLEPPDWEIRKDSHNAVIQRRQDIGLSCYHVHKDQSGVIYSTAKRPIMNMRPDYIHWLLHKPTGLAADLIGLEFLERSGVPYDVVCDHDLHTFGGDAVRRYGTIVTGSHPEYHTVESLQAYREHIKRGGNVMYLGGNGFYWSCASHPSSMHRVEIRRGDQGCRPFTQPGGDRLFSTNGQQGLLWRSRGLPSNVFLGVGCCACGLGPGVPYRRTEASKSPDMAWMFQDIAFDELIGKNGFAGGASGAEIDKCDYHLGSAANTIIVATSIGHSDLYAILPEDAEFPMVKTLGTQTNEIRSDITYYKSGAGGAVFSVGSINWFCSLGWNKFDNEVARLTGNVLREFCK